MTYFDTDTDTIAMFPPKRIFFVPVNLNNWDMISIVEEPGFFETFLATNEMEPGDMLLLYVGKQKAGVESGIYAFARILQGPFILSGAPDDYCNNKLSVLARIEYIQHDNPIFDSNECKEFISQFRSVHRIKGLDETEFDKKLRALSRSVSETETLLLSRKIDKSMLNRGFTVPYKAYTGFFEMLGSEMKAGDSIDISIVLEDEKYKATINYYNSKHENGLVQVIYKGKAICDVLNDICDETDDTIINIYKIDARTIRFEVGERGAEVTKKSSVFPEELSDTEDIFEGAKKSITVNSYERDPKARRECINSFIKRDGRVKCQICGFDFGEVYGPEYENMIHVHHIVPISKIGMQYKLDPRKDLIPVCPNCHMVLHSKIGESVDELRDRLKKGKNE